MDKNSLRKEINNKIRKLCAEERKTLDCKLNKQFQSYYDKIYNFGKYSKINILSYMPLKDEPDTSRLFTKRPQVQLIFPISTANGNLILRAAQNKFTEGLFGITEPAENSPQISPSEINLALIPGRAFSTSGDRLGRGKGYYDRLLTQLKCPTISLAYQCQIYPRIPTEKHDIKINTIITESHIYSFIDP